MMKIWQRQLVIVAILTSVTSIYLNGTRVLNRFKTFDANESYLSNRGYFGTGNAWTGMLYGNQQRWGSMTSYLSLTHEYDMRRNYGLIDAYDEMSYRGRFSALAQSAVAGWQGYHLRAYGKRLTQGIADELELESLKKSGSPLLIAGVLAAAYTGRTLRYRLTEDVSMEARTDMHSTRFDGQYIGWKSQSLDATAGASYSAETGSPVLNVSKKITSDVSVNYDLGQEHSIGVQYTRGF